MLSLSNQQPMCRERESERGLLIVKKILLSRLSILSTQVTVRKKTVDATRMETRVPSTTKPNFTVEHGVNIIPVNGLSRLSKPWAR